MSIAPRSLAEARALLLSPLGPVARAGQDLSRPNVSFEFFPPKSDEAEANLWKAVTRLAPLAPEFVSVTYGAGGSTRERTHRTVQRILAETPLTPAAHLTCVEASREDVDAVIDGYREAGVRHIVALRGDPPGTSGIGGAYVVRILDRIARFRGYPRAVRGSRAPPPPRGPPGFLSTTGIARSRGSWTSMGTAWGTPSAANTRRCVSPVRSSRRL